MPSLISSILGHTCPRCRKGRLFTVRNPYRLKYLQTMPEQCEVCGQDFRIEPGFYFGASYVSYALNVAWLIPTFLFIRFVLGQTYQTFLIFMFVMLAVLVPVLFRLSRSVWIHMFVKYRPEYEKTRTEGPGEN